MKRNEMLLFFSLLFFILAGLLYAWGPPAWFSNFPYTMGLRFLLSLEAYFLCCSFFFSLRIASILTENAQIFARNFCISFAVIPVYSLLVILNAPIQVLQVVVRVIDIAVWLSIMSVTLFRKSKHEELLFSVIFLLLGILLIAPVVPSIMVITARFFCLAVFFFNRTQKAQEQGMEVSVQETTDLCDTAAHFALSPRETEVLELLVAGKTNNEIAEILFVSLSTVKTHVASIFVKMGARNRLEASALCRKI